MPGAGDWIGWGGCQKDLASPTFLFLRNGEGSLKSLKDWTEGVQRRENHGTVHGDAIQHLALLALCDHQPASGQHGSALLEDHGTRLCQTEPPPSTCTILVVTCSYKWFFPFSICSYCLLSGLNNYVLEDEHGYPSSNRSGSCQEGVRRLFSFWKAPSPLGHKHVGVVGWD